MSSSAYPSSGSGRSFSIIICTLFVHLFFNRQRFRAEGILIPNLHKALPLCVMLNDISDTLKISDLTYKVVAFSEISNFNADECVDWATEMIFLGYDTPSLRILAGLDKPTNFFEVTGYLPEVLLSLNLTQKMGDEATLSYCSYYIKKIANSDNIRNNLTHVYQFCQARDYEKLVYDFYLLHWAWDDIDYGNDYTPYWESAKKDNIEKIVVETAIKWAEENEQHYTQHRVWQNGG